jgi:hypothetical protein
LVDLRIAQPDLANGVQFQVQMKELTKFFYLHLKLRTGCKIRLRYTLSHVASCDQNIDLRPGSIPKLGVESQICIQKLYVLFFLTILLRNQKT